MSVETKELLRVFGHPVHAMLVSLPLGLLALTPVWDALATANLLPEAARIAYFTQLAGLCAGGLAVLTGLWDLMRLLERPLLLTTAFRHALLAVSAVGVFAVSFAVRSPTAAPNWVVSTLDGAGALLLLVSAWFGGHLVFHHGAGIEAKTERIDEFWHRFP